jgi:UDP-glucose 4-epimerase
MVVPRFVHQALRDEPITVYGDGRQTRCFTHVHDAVRAMIGLMDADHTVGEVYNLGSERETPILDLAERVQQLTESASKISFVPYADAYGENFEDMPRRVPSLEKIRAAIGWEPAIGLDDILVSVIDYERSVTPQVA